MVLADPVTVQLVLKAEPVAVEAVEAGLAAPNVSWLNKAPEINVINLSIRQHRY